MAIMPSDLLTAPDPIEWPLHPTEEQLLRYLRAVKYGEVTIKVESGKPVQVEHAIAKVRFVK